MESKPHFCASFGSKPEAIMALIKREVRVKFRRYPRSCKPHPERVWEVFNNYVTVVLQAPREDVEDAASQKTCQVNIFAELSGEKPEM